MSLTAGERRSLAVIEERLSAAAPELASLLAMFNRLTAGEEMPAHAAGRPWLTAALRPRRSRRHPPSPPRCRQDRQAAQLHALRRWSRVCLLLWVIVSTGLVAVAVTLSGAGPRTCPAWTVTCSGLAQAHRGPLVPAERL